MHIGLHIRNTGLRNNVENEVKVCVFMFLDKGKF